MVTAADIGRKVTFLYGPKGYGEGVLVSVNGDQARIKATKLRDTASCTWRRSSQEVTSLASYCTVR